MVTTDNELSSEEFVKINFQTTVAGSIKKRLKMHLFVLEIGYCIIFVSLNI